MDKFLNEEGLTHLWGKIKETNSTPLATTETVGKVKPDGTTITVDEDGTIHSAGGSNSASDVSFDNTDTGLEATNVQSALVEINEDLVGSEQVQEMIDENVLEPLVSPTETIVIEVNEIPTTQDWLFSQLIPYRGTVNFILKWNADDWAEEEQNNVVGCIYRTSGTVDYTSGVNFLKGHIYSCMLVSNKATYWQNMPESFVRNSNNSSNIPYGQPILICPMPFSYPRYLYQMVDITPYNQTQVDELAEKINSLVDGNEVSY